MNTDFIIALNNAVKICNGLIVEDSAFCKGFSGVYPFTTENISGYLDLFNLKDKSLLTVGSSGDQVINAILNGCSDITVLDINPYTKFYYYLKVACILELDISDFLKFLRYVDYPKVFKYNNDVFNKENFNKIKSTLRLLDYESYLFWDKLFQLYDSSDIRSRLFSSDEGRNEVIIGCNKYLQSSKLYNETREKLKKIDIDFIISDIFKVELNRKYDNIWLSNIGTHISRHFTKIMVDKMVEYLDIDGKLLISYLYSTTKDTKYEEGWASIYDLDKTFEILDEYNPELISFIGVNGIKFKDETMKDSVLVYKKSI